MLQQSVSTAVQGSVICLCIHVYILHLPDAVQSTYAGAQGVCYTQNKADLA